MIDLKEFPQTRYQGSKRKILPWIFQVVNDLELPYHTVLDGFGGTGSVSYLFKKLNKEVHYNDFLKFNYWIGKALIENGNVTLSDADLETLFQYSSTKKVVEKNFKKIYFLGPENRFIDNIAEGIDRALKGRNSQYKKAIAYYALFQACIIKRPFNLFHRANLYIRTNEVERNFGNKTTWEQPFPLLMKKFVEEANKSVFDNGCVCRSLNESIFDIDPYGYDLVYLDPPYFNKELNSETSNYQRCYHFLEGLSNYNKWEGLIDFSTVNRRIKMENDWQSKKSQVYSRMEELLWQFRNNIVIFSYKKGGTPSIEYIVGTLKKLGKRVYTKSIHYKYALNNQNGDAVKNREVLIVAI